jgi:hypothetical protein
MPRVAFLTLFVLAACETAGPRTTLVRVETTPPGAVLRIADFGECETPCTIEIDRERAATIAKAGFEPATIVLKPGGRAVSLTLDLAAPTEAVDATALPDLK